MFSCLPILLGTIISSIGVVEAIPTVSITGSKFFLSNGTQWFIKGVAYQLTEDDPLVDEDQCELDASLMQELGANAIRVYHVDSSQNHSGCMTAFADAGIYAFIDLDTFSTYIRIDDVWSWNTTKSDAYRAVMDEFQQYDNVAGFYIGNEVINTLSQSGAAPYLLAAAVDLKTYRDSKDYRKIPIGYSATDTSVLRPMLQDYLVCRSNTTERLDFYSLNSYEWCGSSSYTTSGYDDLESMFEDYPVPVFFSEDGCNTNPPRTFADQAAIFGSDMDGTWSGAIIYEWIQETNDYGLISYGASQATTVNSGTSIVDGIVREGTPTPVSPDFTNLQSQWATLTPTGVSSSAYAATVSTTAPDCPSSTSGGWTVDPSEDLPTAGTGTAGSSVSAASTTATTTTSSSSSTSSGAAGQTVPNPLNSGDIGLAGMIAALLAVGAGAVLLL